MNIERDICGAIPTDAHDGVIEMSHLFVAVDGETYRGFRHIYQGGSSYSWSESYPKAQEPPHAS